MEISRKCPGCGGAKFYGTQITRQVIKVENNKVTDVEDVIDCGQHFGPYECIRCGCKVDKLV